ncbi:hypothetical protein BU25DRAFT_420733 [Macroventuria anomochaeta]|uniref:Uncharacterized protein n=1 Tax=Macroventuria anomochaeta TaxID=301207 RepID=A0ACB6S429_9PLEO|nr:uncharacterized protein BU25DRAFT_420733 [Macroventuria anomochaeta]KAF2628789.1 hypothetical protein BU25DRAFT_420733 [Macroventuria anomochaeta]
MHQFRRCLKLCGSWTHIELTVASRQQLEALINAGDSGSYSSKLALTPDSSNLLLRDANGHFNALQDQNDTIQPFYFIIADRTDFREEGMLGVCLDCSQGEGDVGVAGCSAIWRIPGAGNSKMNWQTGYEMKEAEGAEWAKDDDAEAMERTSLAAGYLS